MRYAFDINGNNINNTIKNIAYNKYIYITLNTKINKFYSNNLRTIILNNVITKYVNHKKITPALDSSTVYSFII